VILDPRVRLVEAGVLYVGVVDRVAEMPDGCGDIDPLPVEMGGIEVRADPVVGSFAESFHSCRLVHQHVGMYLDPDVHPVVDGKLGKVGPVLLRHLPLVVVGPLVFGRPRRSDPVRHLVVRAAAGQSRKRGDSVDVELCREPDGIPELGVGRLRVIVLGMDRVVVDCERRNPEIRVVEKRAEVGLCIIVVEVLPAREVIVARTPATAKFDRVDPEASEVLAGLVERPVAERHREYAYIQMKRARRRGD
jgi:hypothetical protein